MTRALKKFKDRSIMFEIQRQVLDLNEDDFYFFREAIYTLAGISLSIAKKDLVKSRLRQRVLSLKMDTIADYRKYLQSLPSTDSEWQNFINMMTTNKTDWFREASHFDILEQDILPYFLMKEKKKIHVWCAASSTGEEAYSLGLLLNSKLKGTNTSFEILATDIE